MTWLFVLNTLLVLVDASIGYRHAPRLLRLVGDQAAADDENAASGYTVQTVRRMLSAVVSLYMFLNCLAYFRGGALFLMLVTGFILLDGGLVLYLSHRYGRDPEDSDQRPNS